jgi:hypothetical protein
MAMGELTFDVLAATLRQDTQDLVGFHEVLAEKLAEALPAGTVQVRRGGLPFQARRPLAQLTIELGDQHFIAAHQNGRFEHRLAKVVRGIALKNAVVPFPDWLDALTHALWAAAQESEQTRQALERFLT